MEHHLHTPLEADSTSFLAHVVALLGCLVIFVPVIFMTSQRQTHTPQCSRLCLHGTFGSVTFKVAWPQQQGINSYDTVTLALSFFLIRELSLQTTLWNASTSPCDCPQARILVPFTCLKRATRQGAREESGTARSAWTSAPPLHKPSPAIVSNMQYAINMCSPRGKEDGPLLYLMAPPGPTYLHSTTRFLLSLHRDTFLPN